jgi:hypothetical protein
MPVPVALHVAVAPPNAVPAPISPSNGSASVGVGFAYNLIAQDVQTRASVHQFDRAHPLVIQFTYQPQEVVGLDPQDLHIAFFDVQSHAWQNLPTTVDTVNHVLTALTTHFTLFQVRGVARTPAEVRTAEAHQASLAAAGPPAVTVVPLVQPSVAGVPLVVTLPAGQVRPPFRLLVTGAPHAQLQVAVKLNGRTVAQSLALDANGYGIATFMAAPPLTSPQSVLVTARVTRNAAYQTVTQLLTLLPQHTLALNAHPVVTAGAGPAARRVAGSLHQPAVTPRKTATPAARPRPGRATQRQREGALLPTPVGHTTGSAAPSVKAVPRPASSKQRPMAAASSTRTVVLPPSGRR